MEVGEETGGDGVIVTPFRSRLRPAPGDYETAADEMPRLAQSIPGLIEIKSYAAGDGERVSSVILGRDRDESREGDARESRDELQETRR